MAIQFAACSPEIISKKSQTETTNLMRTEFTENCQARREYTAQKRAGTLERLCSCIFDKTMNGLSEEQQITAGFYLYGETHDDFKERLKTAPLNIDTMMVAAEAVGKAAQSCH